MDGMQKGGDRGEGGLRKERVVGKWREERGKKVGFTRGECGVDTDAAKQRAE